MVLKKNASMAPMSDAVQNTISEFVYNPDDGLTFAAYFHRHEEIFSQECSGWEEDEKTGCC